eukprot:3585138-Amphidinium_carterae.2
MGRASCGCHAATGVTGHKGDAPALPWLQCAILLSSLVKRGLRQAVLNELGVGLINSIAKL